jgi:CheY-like chemotaxis protein/HPt (histidine-containing phosphotransfer) domain-containing protein
VQRSALYDLLAQSMAAVVPVPVAHRAASAAAEPAARGTVLLVEDNDINQMVAVGILTGLGYRADVAGDGVQALEMAGRQAYDAILMDCRMPRMDGFTATAELRRREERGAAHTPIIAMTASALVADRERCLAAGMDDYLAKPVNPGELADTLQRWVPADPATTRAATPGAATPGAATPDRNAPGVADPIARRLDELAGDRTVPETALVERLVTSFLARAPQHVAAITDAYRAEDVRTVEDQAHTLRGAAGNIGAVDVMDVCRRIEDTARTGTLPRSLADDLQTLRLELDRVDERLREALSPA